MATFQDILTALPNLSEVDKKKLLQKVLLELAVTWPKEEVVVLDDEQQPVFWIVPDSQYHPWISPEFLAELRRRAANPGPGYTAAEFIAKLNELAAAKERADADSRIGL